MGVKAKSWEYLSEVHIDKSGAERMPGVDFVKIFKEIKEADVKYVKLTITEIVDWNIAPMRKYLHAATIPAFTKKYNDSQKEEKRHHFHTAEVKRFLKAKFLGFHKNAGYEKWEEPLHLDRAIDSMEYWLKLDNAISGIVDKIEVFHTEDLAPEEYLNFINDCEAYYYELFQEMYNVREKPVL